MSLRKELKPYLLLKIQEYLNFNPRKPKSNPAPEVTSSVSSSVSSYLSRFSTFCYETKDYVMKGFSGEEGSIRAENYRDNVVLPNNSEDSLLATVYRDITLPKGQGDLESSDEFRKYLIIALCECFGARPEDASRSKLTELYFDHLNLDHRTLATKVQKQLHDTSIARGVSGGLAGIASGMVSEQDERDVVAERMILKHVARLLPPPRRESAAVKPNPFANQL